MSSGALIADVSKFCGRNVLDCIDQITVSAKSRHYSVVVLDPTFNPSSIIRDSSRLNIHTDEAGKVSSFSIG
jgi:hypothetical protein